MKLRSLLNLVVVLMIGQLLFACNSGRYYEFAAHKQDPYHTLKQKPAPAVAPTLSEVALTAAEEKSDKAAEAPQLEANATVAPAAAPKAIAPKAKTAAAISSLSENPASSLSEAEMMAAAKDKFSSMSKAEKKALKKEVRESMRQSNASVSTILLVLLCLIPLFGAPLAVFLHSGIGTQFWITVLLSILLFIPGMIYGILVVTDTI